MSNILSFVYALSSIAKEFEFGKLRILIEKHVYMKPTNKETQHHIRVFHTSYCQDVA